MEPQLTSFPSARALAAALGPLPSPLWIVDVPRQRLGVWTQDHCAGVFPVSTSRFGLGNRPDSLHTPLGLHRVTAVIGRGTPPGQPFVSREPVGEPLSVWERGEGDVILSRVLPLQGLVPGFNGHSFARHIYLHGTNQEEKLGTPASHGCIRLANRDIIALADAIGECLPHVWIGSVGSF